MRRSQPVVALAALLLCLVGVPAIAQEYPPDAGELTLLDKDGDLTTAFSPGEKGILTATGLLAKTVYDVTFSQSPAVDMGGGHSRDDGFLRATFRIPRDAERGPATLTLNPRGVDGADRSAGIYIIAVEVKSETGSRPGGWPIWLYVGIGIALLVAAAALTAFILRRRSNRTAAKPSKEEVTVGDGTRA